MKPWLAITRLLGIVAILGLVLALFTVPSVDGGMNVPAAMASTIETASPAHDLAVAEVPCCGPAQPFVPDCPKGCPLAPLCHAKILQDVPAAGAVVRWSSLAHPLMPRNDAALDSLAQAPRLRPPQA
ncbi:hypothetical protein [Microvirga guangxiensis]|uniref:Uncharacterized protein n=1 Tax=Microvirga guangxiensis TaxID=549386 RepID=A0A1G5L8W4_9HYPH|nr:hypothetical protein [Microvirga guangxiensis]SCZ08599.1 hypothetical protein SAMN02927923_03970 [Microvirga guangxiensis]